MREINSLERQVVIAISELEEVTVKSLLEFFMPDTDAIIYPDGQMWFSGEVIYLNPNIVVPANTEYCVAIRNVLDLLIKEGLIFVNHPSISNYQFWGIPEKSVLVIGNFFQVTGDSHCQLYFKDSIDDLIQLYGLIFRRTDSFDQFVKNGFITIKDKREIDGLETAKRALILSVYIGILGVFVGVVSAFISIIGIFLMEK